MRSVVGRAPSPRRLAAQAAPDEVRTRAAAVGTRLAGMGVDLDLAPVLDLDAGPAGGIVGDRSFGADPSRAAAYGLAFTRGLADAGGDPRGEALPGLSCLPVSLPTLR